MNRYALVTAAALAISGLGVVGCDDRSNTAGTTGNATPPTAANDTTVAPENTARTAAGTDTETNEAGPITRGINKIDNTVGATAASAGHAGNPNNPEDTARLAGDAAAATQPAGNVGAGNANPGGANR
ncbi:MAG TPA: hypothetical protein VK324_13305 [Tepidisphaeraceae bacterium]|nr:hypothetical protein [Tepidisphaeraceae bacterium]